MVAVAMAVLVVVVGCGPGKPTRSEAFCNDLESGYSVFQILNASVKDGTSTPLDTNQNLRGYLEGWGIDPDQR